MELQYRQPVAWVQLGGTRQHMVDDEGTVLPTENIDATALGPLACPRSKASAWLPRWRLSTVKSGNRDRNRMRLEQVDERIVAAARLAGFLPRPPQVERCRRSPALRLREIIVTDQAGPVRPSTPRGRRFCGETRQGAEKPGRPSADEKWDILVAWEKSTPRDFWSRGITGSLRRVTSSLSAVTPKVQHRPAETSERAIGSSEPRL